MSDNYDSNSVCVCARVYVRSVMSLVRSLGHALQCSAVQSCSVLHSDVHCCATLSSAVLLCSVQWCIAVICISVLFCSVLFCAVRCYLLLCCDGL